MSDYTPTTSEVFDAYAQMRVRDRDIVDPDQRILASIDAVAEFERWQATQAPTPVADDPAYKYGLLLGALDELIERWSKASVTYSSLDEKTMAFEIVREDVPALIAEVDRLQHVRIPELVAEIARLHRMWELLRHSRRDLRRERDELLEDLARLKEENHLLKRRIDGLTRESAK